ncbi:MAG TPA: ATP phosphoribosyltransferase regulatory subunit [Hyphomicrobium sp.]
MGAPSPANFEALEAQARTLLAVFISAGHEAVAPPVIQPAGVFLDVLGEALRGRTYVFTDLNGEELCLRPDLTVPTCRLYLERHAEPGAEAHYCYNGPAFRYQPASADAAHPREFRQAGIESFGVADRERAEARTLALVLTALVQSGLRERSLRIGDLGLFEAVLNGAGMPERWRQRLRHRFWRAKAFRAELKRLTTSPARTAASLPRALIEALDTADPARAEALVAEHLDKEGIDIFGVRSVTEITEALLALAADAKAAPLPQATAAMIDGYLEIKALTPDVPARVAELAGAGAPGVAAALQAFERRNALLKEQGVDMSEVPFSGEFGRNVAYYTGFVFEVMAPALGPASPIAGGGRYDGLLKAVGAERTVPAVGGAIHTERLLAAVRGGKR